ncbi:MAG: hypothetical protein E3J64_02410 [Anaerolineales bacterium]|nr:MAG: hypothetical protein E3J64_02410 [Anaerolineales bacterium]
MTGEPLPGYYIKVECCQGCDQANVQVGADPTVNSIYGSEAAWEVACDATQHKSMEIQVRLFDLELDTEGVYPPVSEQLSISVLGTANYSLGYVTCIFNWDDWE